MAVSSAVQDGKLMPERSVLVVEDEETLSLALQYNLSQEGYRVVAAADGEQALDVARKYRPDLILLDLMLPKLDGLEVCRILRRETTSPILMLTAKANEVDKVVGLEFGADDYITKPFSMRELLARVRAMMRRAEMGAGRPGDGGREKMLRAGLISLDQEAHQATRNGVPLELTPKEYELLVFLMSNPGRAFTRNEILNQVWGLDFVGDPRTVDVHIRWLRKRIEDAPGAPKHLITVRGVGYRFEA